MPMILKLSGSLPACMRWQRAGMINRFVKSPAAPKITKLAGTSPLFTVINAIPICSQSRAATSRRDRAIAVFVHMSESSVARDRLGGRDTIL